MSPTDRISVDVHFLPDLTDPDALAGDTVVVVDILRASTTILTALSHGASAVRPCLTVEEALEIRRTCPEILLGGERGGRRIPGFDLSNSPQDYSRERVSGRTIAFTTTNGTRALLHCRQAGRIHLGAFVNLGRLTDRLCDSDRPVHIVCAGTDGCVTGEDVLFAGCLVDRICRQRAAVLSDSSRVAAAWWQRESNRRPLAEALRETQGGRNLVNLSYDADIVQASRIDHHSICARYDPGRQQIVRADAKGSGAGQV